MTDELDVKQTPRKPRRIGGGLPGPGRPVGSINRATRDVRAAIALLVEGNIGRLEGWLLAVAEGDPTNGRSPDPAKALDLFLRMMEFHIPRLSRAEVDATIRRPEEDATDEELRLLLGQFRLKAQRGGAIDGEAAG